MSSGERKSTASSTGDHPGSALDTLAADDGPTQSQHAMTLGAEVVERYADQGNLGRGGMGEVRLCRDTRIGRDVALKMLRDTRAHQAKAQRRFLREATIQGQLEHPVIVPVYDVDRGDDDRLYFTMKRVAGRTLQEILQELRDGEDVRFTRRRLLSAFSAVCQGVAYAHGRGIVHRDLKPANIMLGDFAEVYVLDWGLAKLMDGDDLEHAEGPPSDDTITIGHTVDGEILGTPGYMAPEQLDGRRDFVDERVDVYALGAILFEMLTLQTLHPTDSLQRSMASTIMGAETRAHVRAPERDVPPELEELCVRATQTDPNDRIASCAQFGESIEAFLDGNRDIELRMEIADECANKGRDAAAVALRGDDPDNETRASALALISRSLALNPDHTGARATLMRLLTTPPATPPPEAKEQLVQSQHAAGRSAAKMGVVAFSGMLAFLPLTWAMGLRDPTMLGLIVAALSGAAVASFAGARHPDPQVWTAPAAVGCSAVALFLLSRMFGPLVLIPGIAAANAVAFSMHVTGRRRLVYMTMFALALLGPLSLEAIGVWPTSYQFANGTMSVVPQLTDFPRGLTIVFLTTAGVTVVLATAALVGRASDDLRKAEERLALHAWQLNLLLPKDSRTHAAVPAEGAAPAATGTR